MIRIRRSNERGEADHGWLHSYHSFSFADYHDPAHMGWGNLRVINEDFIQPGGGFGMHGHRDMEIISYVVAGALAHRDSMGNVESIPAGEIQRMSAGRGVVHSEFNHASDAVTHLLQIWIEPVTRGIPPGYEQKPVPVALKQGALLCIAAPEGGPQAVVIHADARLYAGLFDTNDVFDPVRLPLTGGRKAYVHLVRGELTVNEQRLATGDALLLDDESEVRLSNGVGAEVLVFDLAA